MSNITLFVGNFIYLTEISDANNQLSIKEKLENDEGCQYFWPALYDVLTFEKSGGRLVNVGYATLTVA